ncbi:DUF6600 domain-containing protein [Roseateles cellulosilyticus]|uniref:FecR protein domain-containing protein n=1 Tax=Pelomonas cellulosilytica TaxID=2906762 RepID=A0ABS8XQY2_9BURK|nr:DUF6600 domain-containing protein [Pelomonas sp. P8]MCE4553261.1 hypothetical protein [Pelomonas sp. P8]
MTTPSNATRLVLTRSRWRILAMALLVSLVPAAKAQDADRDPPTRAARVVDVIGDAWLFDHETREWVRVARNQTVGEGDRLRTDERGRMSLRVGSTTIWVDERSDLEFSQLDEGQTLLQIDRGDVAVRLRSAENAAETRLRTREGTAQPEREGLYRVEQLDRGSKAYVFQGRLRFEWARAAAPVVLGTGEQVEFWWPDGPRAERGPLYSDGFGDWVLAASRDEADRPVARYVSPEMTGAEDLDRYGRWETAPDYGTVWIPTTVIAADWAPYRYGHWAWSRLWGWTWVDDAPWGFAPFHYGRWVSWRGRWCWAPGAYVHRPVYAPALVGWVGGGSVSVSVTIGNRPPPPRFGWYPLAPREVYVPAYRHSPRYEHRVNDPRDLRDPVTVQRPHRYRDLPSAVSTLPSPGAPIQALPVRGPDHKAEPWVRPLPVAPGRGELGAVLPTAPTRPREVDAPRPRERDREPGSGWRSDSQFPARRDTPRPPEMAQPLPAQPALVPQPQPQPQRPAFEPPRGGDNVPWRAQPSPRDDRRDERRDDRREERRDEPRRPPQAVMPQTEPPRAMPMPEQRPPAVMEQPRRVEMPTRPAAMPEPPRVQAPAPQPQPQPPQRAGNDGGPRGGKQDGPTRDPRLRHDDR